MSNRKYYLYPQGIKTEVPADTYKEFYRFEEVEKYQLKKEVTNNVVSYNMFDTEDFCGEEIIRDKYAISVEESVENKLIIEQVKEIISNSEEEFKITQMIYFEGFSLRKLALEWDIPLNTLKYQADGEIGKIKKLLKF